MRAFKKIAITAAAVTIAFTGSASVAGAASPFEGLGSLGNLGSLFQTPEEPAPAGPKVTPSNGSDLVDGDQITISGAGFSGAGSGIYVGLVQDDQHSITEADLWMGTKWVKAADIVDGAWSVDFDVIAANAAKGTDCTQNACSIYTMAAHGSQDRTQDTKTPVTFKK